MDACKLWDDGLQRYDMGCDAQPLALYGPQGVGKSTLMNQFAHIAHTRKWIVAHITGRNINTLWESLVSTLTSNGHWPHNYDVVNETLDLELLKELSAQGAGFALLIDDADELPLKDLEAVCIALHEATQDGLRVTLALSGLPTLPAKLAEAQSYAERLFYFLPIAANSPSHHE